MEVVSLDGFVFDLDGTVYLGEKALPGAVDTIGHLRARAKRVLFVSNKHLQPRQAYAEKLARLGIPAGPDAVITSGYVLGYHLSRHFPDLAYYVLGEQALLDERVTHMRQADNPQAAADPLVADHESRNGPVHEGAGEGDTPHHPPAQAPPPPAPAPAMRSPARSPQWPEG